MSPRPRQGALQQSQSPHKARGSSGKRLAARTLPQGWSRNFRSLPVNPKLYQCWIFIGRTDIEAEAPIICPLDAKNWLIGKDPDAGKDWGWGNRGWDGRMASRTQWAWVWANSRRKRRTGNAGVLQSMGSQRVGHDLVTRQQPESYPKQCLLFFNAPAPYLKELTKYTPTSVQPCDCMNSHIHVLINLKLIFVYCVK